MPVIPVNAGLQPYGFFGAFQSMPASSAWTLGYRIVRAIAMSCMRERAADDPALARPVARTIVSAFSENPSYESTRRRFPLLQLVPLTYSPGTWSTSWMSQRNATTRSGRRRLRQPSKPAHGCGAAAAWASPASAADLVLLVSGREWVLRGLDGVLVADRAVGPVDRDLAATLARQIPLRCLLGSSLRVMVRHWLARSGLG